MPRTYMLTTTRTRCTALLAYPPGFGAGVSGCTLPSPSTARIKASPFIPRKESVRGFIYEVETGRLREVNTDVHA